MAQHSMPNLSKFLVTMLREARTVPEVTVVSRYLSVLENTSSGFLSWWDPPRKC